MRPAPTASLSAVFVVPGLPDPTVLCPRPFLRLKLMTTLFIGVSTRLPLPFVPNSFLKPTHSPQLHAATN